jgi:hypothetical protein
VHVASGHLECATGASAQHMLLAAAAPRTAKVSTEGTMWRISAVPLTRRFAIGVEHQKGTRGTRIVASRPASAARDGDQHRAMKRGGGQQYPSSTAGAVPEGLSRHYCRMQSTMAFIRSTPSSPGRTATPRCRRRALHAHPPLSTARPPSRDGSSPSSLARGDAPCEVA